MLRSLALVLLLPAAAIAADTDDSDGSWPADTFCAVDTTDTDQDDCDGVNDGETDVSADTDTDGGSTSATGDLAGDVIGEAGGPACASVSVAGGVGIAAGLLGMLSRRRAGR
ncbi:MAG TPA: hypothetical protein PKA64_03865 [Myxococcota bacterium]|nr:hypothetical protein [Myxococcota bacterium]